MQDISVVGGISVLCTMVETLFLHIFAYSLTSRPVISTNVWVELNNHYRKKTVSFLPLINHSLILVHQIGADELGEQYEGAQRLVCGHFPNGGRARGLDRTYSNQCRRDTGLCGSI